MNNRQKLGSKVFYYYISRKISLGIFVLVASIIIASFKTEIFNMVSKLAPVDISILIVNYFVWGLFILSAAILIFSVFLAWVKYLSCDFTLDENAFNIRRGLLTKKEVSIPYRQIQNINIEQSFAHKMMGIGRLVVLTDGDREETDGVFDVIDYNLSKEVRDFILKRTNLQAVGEAESNTVINNLN